MMGGRCAEQEMLGSLSTGASNDLQRATELARKMVREWGMSERVGPMAWGSEGAVFLGEDLMHTRDYSDVTSRVIDEEVERILREQESRAIRLLREHRDGLGAVANALLEKETVDGAEVGRLVDEAAGRPTPIRPRPPIPGPGGPAEKVEAQERAASGGDGDHDRTQELPDSPRPAWRER
jgi:cell division protease FtsH